VRDTEDLERKIRLLERRLYLNSRIFGFQYRFMSLVGKFGALLFIGPGLSASIRNWYYKYKENRKQLPEEETIQLTAAVIKRLTAVGIFGFALAFIPTILLFQQNRLIEAQNERIDRQNQLAEASRRSSLVFELTSILDEIDEEIDATGFETKVFERKSTGANYESFSEEDKRRYSRRSISPANSKKFQLSERLSGRIVALSRSLRPYKYLDDFGKIIDEPLSPERGQLLSSLVKSGVDMEELNHDSDLTFSKADLSGVQLRDINLTHAKMQNANLENAELSSAIFQYTRLDRANLAFSNLSGADLRYSTLSGSNLFASKLNRVKFDNTDLSQADLRCADFSDVENWESVGLLDGAKIGGNINTPNNFEAISLKKGAIKDQIALDCKKFIGN
jgi:uncharacterized protein YjbI with pentapeptide repeats